MSVKVGGDAEGPRSGGQPIQIEVGTRAGISRSGGTVLSSMAMRAGKTGLSFRVEGGMDS